MLLFCFHWPLSRFLFTDKRALPLQPSVKSFWQVSVCLHSGCFYEAIENATKTRWVEGTKHFILGNLAIRFHCIWFVRMIQSKRLHESTPIIRICVNRADCQKLLLVWSLILQIRSSSRSFWGWKHRLLLLTCLSLRKHREPSTHSAGAENTPFKPPPLHPFIQPSIPRCPFSSPTTPRSQLYKNILAQSCQTRLSSLPWVSAADMAAKTFVHISNTRPSDGFLQPAASSEGVVAQTRAVLVDVCVCLKGGLKRMSLMELTSAQSCAEEEVTAGPRSVSAQPFSMDHTHTYSLWVIKKLNPLHTAASGLLPAVL